MSGTEVLVVADDLTGAADTAVPFVTRGMPATVSLDGTPGGTPVVSVDTDTRRATAEQAGAAVRAVVREAREAGARRLYKKVDSTLRGNVGAELAAFADETQGQLCVFAPAFPATGRTTRDGVLLLDGQPLGRTEMWRLARQTAPEDISGLLSGTGLRTLNVHLAQVRGDPGRLAAALASARDSGSQVAICDAETEEDLGRLVTAGRTLGDGVVWAGSAGLAAQLAAQLPERAPSAGAGPVTERQPRGRTLVLIGSASERARSQAQHLLDAGVRSVTVDAAALLDDDRDVLRSTAEELEVALTKDDVLVTLADGDVIGQRRAARQAVSALAELLATPLPLADTLVVTGGETARALLLAMGATSFQLLGQIEPGVVQARVEARGRSWTLVTKAGAFGDAAVLTRALHTLS